MLGFVLTRALLCAALLRLLMWFVYNMSRIHGQCTCSLNSSSSSAAAALHIALTNAANTEKQAMCSVEQLFYCMAEQN